MIKRLFDILASAIALVVLLPLILLVAYKVSRSLGKPVVFTQVRPGKNGQLFKMFKFRSMLDAVDNDGNALPDSERLTPFGKKLRSSSLDELPSLWNVLKGDMSFVGPRPLLVKYLPFYTPEENRRHNLRPGITGWAQVNGRNNLSWDKRLLLDVWYVAHQSFWLDLKIIFLTLKKVVKSEDVIIDPRSVMLDLDEERKQK